MGQQARWLEITEEYSFQVEHRPGSRHGNADGLSRRQYTMYQRSSAEQDQVDEQAQAVATVCLSIPVHSVVTDQRGDVVNDHVATLTTDTDDAVAERWSLDNLRIAQESDPDISCVLTMIKQTPEKPHWEKVALETHDVRVLWGMWPSLRVHNGILQRKFEAADGTSVSWQVILPTKLRREFLTVVPRRDAWWTLGSEAYSCFSPIKSLLAYMVLRLKCFLA